MKFDDIQLTETRAKQKWPTWKAAKLRLAAVIGLAIGVAAAGGYLLLGGEYLLFVPQWAKIIFYPGFVAGEKAANMGWGVDGGKVVGVATVGLSYAAIAVLIHLIWNFVKRK